VADLRDGGVRDILAVGGTAVGELVDDPRPITKLRVGPAKRPSIRLLGTDAERVVPTWHPSYCLRNADAFPTFSADVAKLTRAPREAWVEPSWSYAEEEELALQELNNIIALQTLTGNDKLVIDIEVGIDKEVSFDHPNNFELLCVGLGYVGRNVFVVGEKALGFASVRDLLLRLLRRSKLIAHNGKFDLAGLYNLFKGLVLWADTMLAHYVLDERPGTHGLKVLGPELLGTPQWDEEIRQFVPRGGNYANIPREILYKYNALDIGVTWDLWEMFEADLDMPVDDWPYDTEVRTLRDVHDFLVAASNQLMFMELNGITIDRAYQSELRTTYLERLAGIEGELNAIVKEANVGSTGINPRSPKQVKEFLASQRLHVDSTNVDTLERIVGRTSERSHAGRFVRTMLHYRREHKLYSTYVEGFRKRMYRGRVYTTYMLHGTTSGRLASRNPNLQNVVRDKGIKRQFVASADDRVLIQADYKQAEGRVVAHLSKDPYLTSVFASGEDIFDQLSDQLFGYNNWGKEERVRTKAFFYGLAYGREAPSIAAEFGFSLGETQRLLAEFLGLMPNVVEWQNDIRRRVLAGRPLITPFGRQRRFSLITEQNRRDIMNEALSFLPQSTASDICLGALIDLRPKLRGKGFIRLTIHDALTVECNKSDADEVAEMLRYEMVEHGRKFTEHVPFAVDISMGRSWGDL